MWEGTLRCVRHLAESPPKRYITRVMAYTYEIDVDRRLVIATFSADANLADAEQIMAEVTRIPAIPSSSTACTTVARSLGCRP